MRKKTVTILIVISTIINIFAAAFLFLNIQVMQPPNITITMELKEFNSEEATLQIKMEISNPNSFEIITRDLEIITLSQNKEKISSLKIVGGSIPANKNKIFIGTSIINFKGCSPEELVTKVSGVVGAKIGFIEKTLPISATIITDLKEVLSNIVLPIMYVKTSFGEITQKNVNITFEVETYNPNNFDLIVKDIVVDMKNEIGGKVGNLILPDLLLTANGKTITNGTGEIIIEALNAEILTINISANVGATIASYEKTLKFNIKSEIAVPNIKTLFPSIFPTQAIIRGDYRASLFGLLGDIVLETHNPNDIEFDIKDIKIEVSRIDRNTKRKITEGEIEDGIIKANDITILKGQVLMPYRKIVIPPFGGRFIPDWLEVSITANVTICGLNEYVWIGVIAAQDLHPLRRDRSYDTPKEIEWI